MADQLTIIDTPDERVHGGADFSECKTYRYALHRWWGDREWTRRVVFVGLNPSKAGGEVDGKLKDDPTAMRFLGFSRSWGALSYTTVNLFARVSTDPLGLLDERDPVGPGNNDWIAETAASARLVIVCWGAPSDARLRKLVAERVKVVLGLLKNRTLYCMGLTKDGMPRHPLYLPGSTKPHVWSPRHA